MFPESVKLIIIDDELRSLKSMSTLLRVRGFPKPILINNAMEAMKEIAQQKPHAILLDLHMPNLNGQSLLATIKQEYPDIIVIVITADDQLEMAVKCIQLGAYDYFVKPIDQERLIHSLKKAIDEKDLNNELCQIQKHLLSSAQPNHNAFSSILTKSNNMMLLFKYIEAISKSNRPVLILGETGTGKELFAKAVHDVSENTGKFVAVNVAGLDDSAFSDSLFGHEKGAFTGANNKREGLIQKAQNGSLFLDEIGDLDQKSQIKLLRLLQENTYYPLGSDKLVKSTARIITATHQPLETLISKGKFRRDLFFRLQLHTIQIPPLCDRKEDIPLLTEYFLQKACEELGRNTLTIPSKTYDLFDQYRFLGNVRELEILIYDAVVHTQGDVLDVDNIFRNIDGAQQLNNLSENTGMELDCISSLNPLPTIKKMTESLIDEALRRSQDNQKKASTMLGISRQALNKRLLRRSEESSSPEKE